MTHEEALKEYKEWDALRKKVAVEMYIMDATDMMVPADEARTMAERRMQEAHACTGAECGATHIQKWLLLGRSAGSAIIAMEKLGLLADKTKAD